MFAGGISTIGKGVGGGLPSISFSLPLFIPLTIVQMQHFIDERPSNLPNGPHGSLPSQILEMNASGCSLGGAGSSSQTSVALGDAYVTMNEKDMDSTRENPSTLNER